MAQEDQATIREVLKGLKDKDGNPKKVIAEIQEIPVSAEMDFDNLFGKYTTNVDQTEMGGTLPIGTAKLYAMRYALVSLYWGEENTPDADLKKVDLPAQNPATFFPRLRKENHESIIISVVQAVVKHNDWLGHLQPYAGVFMPFLPRDVDTSNPTPMLSASSSSTSEQSSEETEHRLPPSSPDSVRVTGQEGTPEV